MVRAFSLALLTMSAIFVLFMVAAQARDIGLSPNDIAELVPYVIPSTLPYTIPVSLLFAVTVVYGRLAGDNEIIAVKTAGVSVMKILWPTFLLAIGLSVGLLFLSGTWIPQCTQRAHMVLFKDLEDMFYKVLKKEHEFNSPRWPFLIKVRDVKEKEMIDATFKHRVKGQDDFDLVIQAKKAVLHIDLNAKLVRVHFDDAEIQHYRHDADVVLINDRILEIPIPPDSTFDVEKKIQEFTNRDLKDELRNQDEADRHRAAAAGDRQRVPLRDGPHRSDQLVGRAGCLREPRVCRPQMPRAGDRMVAPAVDGVRQPDVRDLRRADRHPVRPA